MLDWESALANTPDISFIDNRGVDDIRSEMVADYEAYISAATGETVTLDRSSPHRMELYAAADQIYQAMQYIDRTGKQNLLKYSYGDSCFHHHPVHSVGRTALSCFYSQGDAGGNGGRDLLCDRRICRNPHRRDDR